MSQAAFDELSWDDLMALEARQSEPIKLEDEDIRRFNARTVLYKVDQLGYQLPLMPAADSGQAFLKDVLQELVADSYLDIGQDKYVLTPKAHQELEAMAEQYHSLVEHYDIFANVDLDTSAFLEPGDDPKSEVMIGGEAFPRFIDLRVAVMRFKGISPFDMVFLNLLREGRIGKQDNWEFDLALGRALYDEVEEIVNTAYTVSDLSNLKKTNENGEIPGSDILRDVIIAGNQINQERALVKQVPKKYDMPEQQHQTGIEYEIIHEQPLFVDHHYDAHHHYGHYRDPFYVEPSWKRNRYRKWFDD